MKRFIVIGAALVVAAVAIAPASASAHSGNKYQRACHNDGYGSVTKLYAGKQFPSLSCSGAISVMTRWMERDDCWEGTCPVRVGYKGWLWKCYAYRTPNQLREYNVGCNSAKKVWVNKHGGYFASRYLSFIYTD